MMISVPLPSSLHRTRHLALFFSLELCSMWLPCFYSVRISRLKRHRLRCVIISCDLRHLGDGNMSKRIRRPAKSREERYRETLLRRLGGKEELREFLESEATRRAQLENDGVFVRETEALQ